MSNLLAAQQRRAEARALSATTGALLFVVFVVLLILKLGGPLAGLSWWLVTLPLWIGPATLLALFVLGVVAILAGASLTALAQAIGKAKRK